MKLSLCCVQPHYLVVILSDCSWSAIYVDYISKDREQAGGRRLLESEERVCLCGDVCVCVYCICVGDSWYASFIPHTEGDATPHTLSTSATNLLHYSALQCDVCVCVSVCLCVTVHKWVIDQATEQVQYTNNLSLSTHSSAVSLISHMHKDTHAMLFLHGITMTTASAAHSVGQHQRRSSVVTMGDGGPGCKHVN